MQSEEMKKDIQHTLGEIAEFVYTPRFYSLITELRALPVDRHKAFVRDVIINVEELKKRGIDVPTEMIVQR